MSEITPVFKTGVLLWNPSVYSPGCITAPSMKRRLFAALLAAAPAITPITQLRPAIAQTNVAAVSPDTQVSLPGLYYDPDAPTTTFSQLPGAEQAGYVDVPPLPDGVQLPYLVDRAWPQGATPDQIIKFGDLDQNPVTADFTKLSVRQLTASSGTNIGDVPVGDVALLNGLTIQEVDDLYTKINNGEKIKLKDAAPALQAAFGLVLNPGSAPQQLQNAALTVGERVALDKLSKVKALEGVPLQDLARGNWEGVIDKADQIKLAGIGKKIGPTLKKLPVKQIVPIVGDAIGGDWRAARRKAIALAQQKGTEVAVKELLKEFPQLKDVPIAAIPGVLNKPVDEALPEVADLAIEHIPGAKDKTINSVPGLEDIPINDLPLNLAFSFFAGDVFARFDIAYSGVDGPEEPSTNHALSGGSEDQKFKPIKCTVGESEKQRADNCPHFEMRKFIDSVAETAGLDSDIEGKQWVQGDSRGKNGQGVKGGKGLLKWVNGGWEPAGIHPFGTGSHTKFVLKKITEYPDKKSTARLYLALQTCISVPILGQQCTPHWIVLPTPYVIREDGLFLVASRRNLPADIAKIRNGAIRESGLINQVYCDPDQIIASTGQSDVGAADTKQGDISDLQAQAEAEGVVIQPIDGSTGAPRLDGIPGQPGAVSRSVQSANNRPTTTPSNGVIRPIDGAIGAPRLDGIPGQPDAVSSQGSTASTPADPDHNVRQYLARISRGESTRGVNDFQRKDTGAKGEYQFIPKTRRTILDRHGVDAWSPNKAERDQAVLALIRDFSQETGEPIMDYIRSGDFAAADRVLGRHVRDANGRIIRYGQFTSLPGGAEAHADWNDPALLEQYGPSGDAGTNAPIDVASSGLPCRPGAIASTGVITPEGDGIATGQLQNPLQGYSVTSEYGLRTHPVTGEPNSFHAGIDIGAPTGSPVHAADGGTVDFAGFHPGGHGNLVVIRHGNGLATWYAHNSAINVRVGQDVSAGDKVAEVGSTGTSTGPHLDFGVRTGYIPGQPYSGQHHNPRDFVNF